MSTRPAQLTPTDLSRPVSRSVEPRTCVLVVAATGSAPTAGSTGFAVADIASARRLGQRARYTRRPRGFSSARRRWLWARRRRRPCSHPAGAEPFDLDALVRAREADLDHSRPHGLETRDGEDLPLGRQWVVEVDRLQRLPIPEHRHRAAVGAPGGDERERAGDHA